MRKPTGALEAALMKNPNPSPMAQNAPGQIPAQAKGPGAAMENGGMPGGFYEVVEELEQLVLEGRMPPEFDLRQACMDPAFAALIATYPAEAAVRIYCAENKAAQAEQDAMQRVNAQVRSRQALPRSARGGVMSAPSPNYRDMDDATFKKLLAQMKRNARSGVATRL